jgi:hypothetical protein
MLMPERHAGKPHEGEHLEAVAVVVGNAEQLGIGIECNQGASVQELLALGLQIATNHGLGRAPLLLADKVGGSRSRALRVEYRNIN